MTSLRKLLKTTASALACLGTACLAAAIATGIYGSMCSSLQPDPGTGRILAVNFGHLTHDEYVTPMIGYFYNGLFECSIAMFAAAVIIALWLRYLGRSKLGKDERD